MRVEEELTEAELLELAKETEKADVEGKDEEEEERVEDQLPISVRRYTEVVQTVRTLVAGRSVDFETLVDLTEEERDALEELAAVLKGADGTRFLFAEDRLTALNHTLAVLQPALGVAVAGAGVDELRMSFEVVVDQINVLRDHLRSLEDAEDLQFEREVKKKKDAEDDDDDDDDDDGEDGDGDAAPAADTAAPAEGTPAPVTPEGET